MSNDETLSRRGVLRGATLGGAALAATSLLPAGVATASDVRQVPGVSTVIDASHATREVAARFSDYFRTKSSKTPDGLMAFFDRRNTTYIDAILGWPFYTWQELHDLFAEYMPQWPKDGTSSPVRVLGDATSAVVFFTNSVNLFGPSEMRAAGVVNFNRQGRITRWVDYWDGRHFGTDNLNGSKLPDDQFPRDFKESLSGETAASTMRRVSDRLNTLLRNGESAASLFAYDAVFEDVSAHLQIIGPRSISAYLTSATGLLPYTGNGVAVRHVAGSAAGGGYEWTATGRVPRGLNALELDEQGKITRLTAVWDGTRVDDQTLISLAQKAIEH
ncbi:hypothetical protein ACFWNN_32630 [Lentzea sp. NPDC058450]|uniref:hypothetical protein n=1 Tax=Lentzea sp. NPDC058450 TaxID=3346505 RepID=UPI00364FB1FE